MTTNHSPRILVAYGSKRGGTEDIAKEIAKTLREHGKTVDCMRAGDVRDLAPYSAVIVGGALYMMRWHREARRFIRRHEAELRKRPVWMFSSGPLDLSAAEKQLPPVPGVATLMARIGARGHVTFGGRLAPDATGWPASAMAKKHAGDWRDWGIVREWADAVSDSLASTPRPLTPAERPSRWLLVTLCFAVAITAIGGGVALVAAPDGSYVHMPVSTLSHSPFSSFLIPGLLLLLVIGLGNLFAGIAVARDSVSANFVAFLGGVALLVWIVMEMVFLRTANFLQLSYLGVAIAIIAAAGRRAASSSVRMPMRPMRT